MHKTLQPQGWARPIGYANGVEARGRLIFIGGQIGWNGQQQFETDDFVEQTGQTLQNIVDVLAEAGGRPEHITSMTWYFTDKAEYNANLKGIGRVYRDIIGKHFPAMAAVQVVALVEDRAKIEIQAHAVIPD
ncbi:enamine deaminase RidA [Brucella anthropi]|uniref:RidA family protein n=1 Tax=Brucella anthropi TaxID=529 RepID=UPI0039885418